jgi:hypothetical protein
LVKTVTVRKLLLSIENGYNDLTIGLSAGIYPNSRAKYLVVGVPPKLVMGMYL